MVKFRKMGPTWPPEDIELVLYLNESGELTLVSAVISDGTFLIPDVANDNWVEFLNPGDLEELRRTGAVRNLEVYWAPQTEVEQFINVSDDNSFEIVEGVVQEA